MQLKETILRFILCRDIASRRIEIFSTLPYITEEGLVLINRRSIIERRLTQSRNKWQH